MTAVCFNPRTRVGCDRTRLSGGGVLTTFQSTHPRGVRPGKGHRPARHAPAGFNPRTRVGCDHSCQPAGQEHDPVSIHAPAWGATWRVMEDIMAIRVSIHAPAWGATYGGEYGAYATKDVSIHAPAWGATARSGDTGATTMFQSTHPRGVRRASSRRSVRPTARFNPRTRVGCDCASFTSARPVTCFNPRTRVGCDCLSVRSVL